MKLVFPLTRISPVVNTDTWTRAGSQLGSTLPPGLEDFSHGQNDAQLDTKNVGPIWDEKDGEFVRRVHQGRIGSPKHPPMAMTLDPAPGFVLPFLAPSPQLPGLDPIPERRLNQMRKTMALLSTSCSVMLKRSNGKMRHHLCAESVMLFYVSS